MAIEGFQGFPKIPRLNREIIVTEKIDGTNAQIFITEDGGIYPGSRKRYLNPENDNFGFAAWVHEHADELVDGLGPGRHFGEWWGQGIQRGYELDHRRFSLFNASRWIDRQSNLIGRDLTKCELVPPCCNVVPALWRGLFSQKAMEETLDGLRVHGSMAAYGYEWPEGIVIYHTAGNCLFKVTLEDDEKPKERINGK